MTQKPLLKIDFCDFWPDFDKEYNPFYKLLSDDFELQISSDPDILFFSDNGYSHLNRKAVKVFYSGENIAPDYRYCNYSLTYRRSSYGGRNLWFPIYRITHMEMDDFLVPAFNGKSPEQVLQEKRQFCSFVVSNARAKRRIDFFQKLSKYKKVASGGRVLNNIGGPINNKLEFLSGYKFNLCFENYSFPFYTTEKIVDAMRCRAVPIYWGSPVIGAEFNEKSIINAHSFSSDEELIEHIIRVDQDDELYLKYLSESYYRDNVPSPLYDKGYLADFIKQILIRENLPVAHGMPLLEKFYAKAKRRVYRRYSYQYDWRV